MVLPGYMQNLKQSIDFLKEKYIFFERSPADLQSSASIAENNNICKLAEKLSTQSQAGTGKTQ